MSGGKLLMTETIKNRGWLEQGAGKRGFVGVYFVPPTSGTLCP
jgi:hypothetical protein